MKNPIAERIADFLKNHPPFMSLGLEELIIISNHSQVVYLEKNQVLFKFDDQPHSFFYVVKDGAVGLSITADEKELLIDECDEGDIIGIRPFFQKIIT